MSRYTHRLGLGDIMFTMEMESFLASGFAYPNRKYLEIELKQQTYIIFLTKTGQRPTNHALRCFVLNYLLYRTEFHSSI